jgi:cardiolipin synthase
MLEAIRGATHSVWLGTYIFHSDEAGTAICDALCAAAARGVRVRVVVDGFGSIGSLGWLSKRFAGSDVAMAVFRPIDRWWRWLQPGQLRRLHQKLCVVDGERAFVGGVNLISDRLDIHHGRTEQPRLDFSVGLRGPVVAPVEQATRAVWSRAWLGRDFGEEFLAALRGPGRVQRITAMLRGLRLPRAAPDAGGALPPVCAAFVLRDNLRRRRAIEHAYVDAIRGARDSVELVCPYFYPGERIRRELRRAALRGVRVRLLLQGKLDYRLAGMAAQALYTELLAHGVEIYEYTPAFLHAKVAVVDGHWATVGSSNIDPLSLLLNLEANVLVLDREFAVRLRDEIETAMAVSTRVEADATQGVRGMLRRALVAWLSYVFLRVAGATGRY